MSVYLDHNATTPMDVRVVDAMLPLMREFHGNPSSLHRSGRFARAAIETARQQVAALVKARPDQIVFTSGGSEANNLALKGVAAIQKSGQLLIGATEHASVAKAAEQLSGHGWTVRKIPVDRGGCLDLAALESLVQGEGRTIVSVMTANNETGTIQDINAIGERVREAGAVLHSDAVQAAGKVPIDMSNSAVQLLSLSAHKIGGPKGVGALVLDASVDIEPLVAGGGQEKGRRSGTENVAGIAGFGVAAELAMNEFDARHRVWRECQSRLESGLQSIEGVTIFSGSAARLANTVCFAVDGIDGETLVMALDRAGFCVSSGSACASGAREPNPVLLAMGVSPELARGAMRVSVGAGNGVADMDAFVSALGEQIKRLCGAARRACA